MRYRFLAATSLALLCGCFLDVERTNPLDVRRPGAAGEILPAPEGFTVAARDRGFQLSWDSVPEAVGYTVVRNGSERAVTAALSYIDSNLDTSETYAYAVAARDSFGLGGCLSTRKRVQAKALPQLDVWADYRVFCDDNGDSLLNKGEEASLWTYVVNTGSADAVATVGCTASVASPYVSLAPSACAHGIDSTVEFTLGIRQGDSVGVVLGLYVSPDCPAGHVFDIRYRLIGAEDRRWHDTVGCIVVPSGASLELVPDYVVFCDDNGDNLLSSGEKATLKTFLTNTGTARAIATVGCTASVNSPYVSFAPSACLYGIDSTVEFISSIGPGDTVALALGLAISAECPANHEFQMSYRIRDNNNNWWYDTASYRAGP